MKYLIHESNIERLEKKLTTIGNKCKKYGCVFTYEVVGEQFEEDSEGVINRYIEVETTGLAKVNDWVFVATVDFHDNGNVIRKCGNIEVEVPERYYTSEPVCEHCNTKRRRKDAYIVMNTKTGEFKQVGRSCLKDFTCGLSAELVAQYISAFNSMIEGESVTTGWHTDRYYNTKEYLQYVAECISHFGFYGTQAERSTKVRAYEYLMAKSNRVYGSRLKQLLDEMEEVEFKQDAAEVAKLVENVLEWIAGQKEENSYIHNVKVLASQEYITYKDFGFIASLIPTYNKAMKIEEKRKEQQEVDSKSCYVGNIGDRITVEVQTIECIASWDTQYGATFIYKMVDEQSNVYIWKTGKGISNQKATIVGTIKEHKEFRGVKQTELTRCKIK